ncbi:hypothetical protein O4H66_24975 [Comamonadaceae bacterium G21597-S1]|nr:hypothetical protein [Comamonadaceae bacterium G21597-S1]
MTLTADQIAIAGAVVSAVSAAVAVVAIYVPWRNTSDAALFGEAVLALERAYRSLNASQQDGSRPAPDRLNWLTAARHVESFKELRGRLKTTLYRRLCAEHEEHWRHEFYLSLLKDRILHVSYFESGPIEPRSAVVVYGFAAWPDSRKDPIDIADYEAIFQQSDLLKGNIGLRQYLTRFPEFSGAA